MPQKLWDVILQKMIKAKKIKKAKEWDVVDYISNDWVLYVKR